MNTSGARLSLYAERQLAPERERFVQPGQFPPRRKPREALKPPFQGASSPFVAPCGTKPLRQARVLLVDQGGKRVGPEVPPGENPVRQRTEVRPPGLLGGGKLPGHLDPLTELHPPRGGASCGRASRMWRSSAPQTEVQQPGAGRRRPVSVPPVPGKPAGEAYVPVRPPGFPGAATRATTRKRATGRAPSCRRWSRGRGSPWLWSPRRRRGVPTPLRLRLLPKNG